MGIYLPNMEMPTSCGQCPLHDEDYRGKEHCDIGWKRIGKAEEKPDWCPLVPVPKHGRLIDADAVMNSVTDEKGVYVSQFAAVIGEAVDAAPTIIPEDPAEEGE